MAVHRNQVAALLGGLSPLQEKIVRLYFGIGCERSHSASEIAREFQVSSQVIGGILAGAQRRLAKVGLTPCNQKVCGGTRRCVNLDAVNQKALSSSPIWGAKSFHREILRASG